MNQFGFLEYKATDDSVLEFTEKCFSALNEHKSFTQYSIAARVFDSIDHTMHPKKLENFGMRGKSTKRSLSYITSGTHYTETDHKKSFCSLISCGIT